MKKLFIVLTLFLFFQVMPALPSEIQKPLWTVDDVLSHIKEREQTLETCIAEFRQIQKNSLFDLPQVSEGTLFFNRNGNLLMKMTRPEAYLVFITDQNMIVGVPGSSSYRQKKLPGRNTFFKQMMGIDQTVDQLKRQYDIRMVSISCEERCELELKPLKNNRRTPFAAIRAVINILQWLPETIRLEEPDGDMTTFHLQYTSINQPLPDGIFDIPVPEKKPAFPAGNHGIK